MIFEEVIGQGGMSVVWRGRFRGRPAALKVIRPLHRPHTDQLLEAAHPLLGLRHRRLVPVWASARTEAGDACFVLRLRSGRTLSDLLDAEPQGALGPRRAAWVGARVASGLSALHGAGLLHGDLKPENVALEDASGPLALLDTLDGSLVRAWLRETGERYAWGTPEVMAPEVALARSLEGIGPPADIYGLGCLVFVLASGCWPLSAEDPAETVELRRKEEAPRLAEALPEVPPALDALVAAMLSRDPAARPTLAQARAALQRMARPWPWEKGPSISGSS